MFIRISSFTIFSIWVLNIYSLGDRQHIVLSGLFSHRLNAINDFSVPALWIVAAFLHASSIFTEAL